MSLAVKVVGIVFACLGLLFAFKPMVLKGFVGFFGAGVRVYAAALVRFALAVLFLLAARECDYPWVIGTLGVLFLLSGLVIVVAGPTKVKPMVDWFRNKPPWVLRILSVLVLVFGVVIVYCA